MLKAHNYSTKRVCLAVRQIHLLEIQYSCDCQHPLPPHSPSGSPVQHEGLAGVRHVVHLQVGGDGEHAGDSAPGERQAGGVHEVQEERHACGLQEVRERQGHGWNASSGRVAVPPRDRLAPWVEGVEEPTEEERESETENQIRQTRQIRQTDYTDRQTDTDRQTNRQIDSVS